MVASYDSIVDKVFNFFARHAGSSAAIMLGGLAVTITVLTATAAAGPGPADTRTQAPAAGNRVTQTVQGQPGAVAGQVENAIAQAGGHPSPAGSPNSEPMSGVMRASMTPPVGSWAGPVSQDEMRQAPRRLSTEERSQLRQEIRRASEEVYEPYRQQRR